MEEENTGDVRFWNSAWRLRQEKTEEREGKPEEKEEEKRVGRLTFRPNTWLDT